jgi:alpha-beta hydrolase superfamily lysophospholipase
MMGVAMTSSATPLDISSGWEPDMLGDGWVALTFALAPDDEGEVVATLVTHSSAPKTSRAVLYVHGFVDYFFQTHMAAQFEDHGYTFYAIDLRKYGRSLRAHHTPNYVANLSAYAEELDQAAHIIRHDEGHDELIVVGHSTGGLIASLWADARTRADGPPVIDALVLNSPWFDLNEPWYMRTIVTWLIDLLGPFAPRLAVGKLSSHYGRALHADTGGEWTYDLRLKPHDGFPARAGWLRAVRRGHSLVAAGLDIRCPVLVLTSDASGDAKSWHDALMTTDSVLNVAQTQRRARRLGPDVTLAEVPGGAHDLTLSPARARSVFFHIVFSWLESHADVSRDA